MVANPKLTKAWISYLKNNQIVAYKSDADGKLSYKRRVTSDDMIKFLRDNTHYSEEQIYDAVGIVGSEKHTDVPGRQRKPTSNDPGHGTSVNRADDARSIPKLSGKEHPKIQYDPDSISDIDFREIPNEPKDSRHLPAPKPGQKPEVSAESEPARKPRFKLRKVKESLDDTTFDLDEKDVEQVFSLLSKQKEVAPGSEPLDLGNRESATDRPSDEKKRQEIDKIKLVIRDKMTDSQRKSLWRLLADGKITQGHFSEHDIADVLNKAAEVKPTRKSFWGKKKGGFSLYDLQGEWAKAGYPDDSNKIAHMLKGLGYERKEINKVFRDTFDTKYGSYNTGNSQIVAQLAKYILEKGYTEEIKTFIEHRTDDFDEMEEGLDYRGKIAVEQVRDVFERIIKEERTGLPKMQKEFEQHSLGRHRK